MELGKQDPLNRRFTAEENWKGALDDSAILAREPSDHIIKLEGVTKDTASGAAAPRRHFEPEKDLADLIENGYKFYDRIGKGSLGYVYQAQSANSEALLAVKIFHRKLFENKRSLKRLEQEASRARELSHPHISAVYEFGVCQKGYPYIVGDFMAGPSIQEVLKEEGFLDVPRALDIFAQVADALDYIHENGCLHRDLKPSNIYLLKAQGGGDYVKLIDVGIAKFLPNPGRETKFMTPEGEEFGNPTYMSPEQCKGDKLTVASDLYALGCTLYECLCGKPPLTSSNPVKLAFKQVSEKPRSLTERFNDLDIPESLDAVVMRLLEKEPQNRYASARELREDLVAISEGRKPKLKKVSEFKKTTQGSQPGRMKTTEALDILGGLLDIINRKKNQPKSD